jgi:hypothetical protein
MSVSSSSHSAVFPIATSEDSPVETDPAHSKVGAKGAPERSRAGTAFVILEP